MTNRFFNYRHGACLALAVSAVLAGCNKPAPAPVAATTVAAPANPLLDKVKRMQPDARKVYLADSRWAKEADAYGKLMDKAITSGEKLSDVDAIELGDNLRQANSALVRVAGTSATEVMYVLRAEQAHDRVRQQALSKFSRRYHQLRRPKSVFSAEQERQRNASLAQHQKYEETVKATTKAPLAAPHPTAPAAAPAARVAPVAPANPAAPTAPAAR